MTLSSEEIVKITYDAIEDKKGIDIKIVDIHDISTIADYFIIAGALNQNQVKAIVDNIQDNLLKEKCHARQIEGYTTANWVLLDYNDVIIHIFNQDDRVFYDIERIWNDGKNIKIEEL